MSFPSDIKSAMRDCILKIFWPKDHIVQFFVDNGCTNSDIRALGDYKVLARYKIIDRMFDHLAAKPDGGLGPFRSMLKSLVSWSSFDPYYFDSLKKLNRADAERSITHLKQLQEIRDHKIQEERKARAAKEAASQNPKQTISELKEKYIALIQGSSPPARRGYELENVLQELGKLSNLEVTEPYRVNGEQIDGAIKFEGEHYLVEAKWQDKASSNEPIYQFVGKIEGKFYGRGVFISVNGFSENVVTSLVHGKAIKTIFVDGEDLMMVLEGFQSFSEMLDKKVKAAQTRGEIYIHAVNGKSKIS
ncbi:restriction endonuclease [Marinobacter sp. 1Y8]